MTNLTGMHKSLVIQYCYLVWKCLRRVKPMTFPAFLLVAGILLTTINIYRLGDLMQAQLSQLFPVPHSKKLYRLVSRQPAIQEHLVNVLERNGYRQTTRHNGNDWDFMWTHENPFFDSMKEEMKNLRPGQKVNHIPGTGFITNKVYLSKQRIKSIPPSFSIPDDKAKLMEWMQKNPKKLIVTKNNNHRGVKIQNVQDIDFSVKQSLTFAQEFIDKPLLIDGYKFDIGVYVTLTSTNPLRLYVHQSDVLLRFCPEKYLPFDPTNTNKYVVQDDYLPAWKVPSISKFYNDGGFSGKDTLNAYIRSIGKNPDILWEQVHSSLVDVYKNQEKQMDFYVSKYQHKNVFFEMVRFDFVIDDDLNVRIMEANMSPNLSSEHFPPNRLLYEQVIHSLLRLVGVISRSVDTGILQPASQAAIDMQAANKDVYVFPESCASSECSSFSACSSFQCELCKNCLSDLDREMLLEAYLEQVRQFATKRIYPVPVSRKEAIQSVNYKWMTDNNRKMDRWYRGKCLMDSTWCGILN